MKSKVNQSRLLTLTEEELRFRILESAKDNTLPHDDDTEIIVLGTVLLDAGSFGIVNKTLSPDHFYHEKNRIIYQAIMDLDEDRIPIDMITLIDKLRNKKQLREEALELDLQELQNAKRITNKNKKRQTELEWKISSFPSIYDLASYTDRVASSAHLEAHIHILHKLYLKRDTLIRLEELRRKIYEDPDHSIITARNELSQQLHTSTKSDVLVLRTATERQVMGSRIPIRRSIMGSLIREGDIGFLFAEAKTGKTTFAYQLAAAISEGRSLFPLKDDPFRDGENTDDVVYLLPNNSGKKKVLYYDLEMEDDEFYQRTALRGAGEEYEFNDNLLFASYNPDYYDYSDDFFKKMKLNITSFIEMARPNVVFIDNVTAMTIEALQDAKVAKRLSGFIKGLKVRYDFLDTIIILGHCPKRYNKTKPMEATDLRGASALSDLTKNLIAIGKSSYDDGLVYVKHIFSRNTLREFDDTNVISCRINVESTMMEYEFIELCEEKELLPMNDNLFGEEELDEDDLIYQGFQMYQDGYKYTEIARDMKIKIHWSLPQWRRKIRSYASDNLSQWDGLGEIPRGQDNGGASDDAPF